jgi:DNA-binding MurR/RpiR family transcriptional regulator
MHWSTRTLAQVVGVSPSTVRRVWRARGLKAFDILERVKRHLCDAPHTSKPYEVWARYASTISLPVAHQTSL